MMTRELNSGRKILGFDMDGVIVNHTKLKQKIAKKHGFILKPNETHSYIMRGILPPEVNREIQHEIYVKYFSQPLFPGVKKLFKDIKKKGIAFYLISRRKKDGGREAATMILKGRGLWPEFFNEKNTFFVDGPEEKNKKAKKLGVTHYTDDELMVLETMKDVPNRFLFDSFNNFKNEKKFRRVKNWEQLQGELC